MRLWHQIGSACIATIAHLAVPVAASEASSPTSKHPTIEQVSTLVRRHFFDPAKVSQLWPRVLDQHASNLPADAPPGRIHAAVDAMLAALEASHTDLYTPKEVAYFELLDIFAQRDWRTQLRRLFPAGEIAYSGIGIIPRSIEGRTFLAAVYHGGPAARANLRVGDEIVAADGHRFDPVASFVDRAGQPVQLQFRRHQDGPVQSVEITPEQIRPSAFFLEAMRSSVRVIKRADRQWGYIRVWSYAGRAYHRQLIQELAQGRLKNVDGLVLDLRGGWGGAQPDYAELFVGGAPVMTFADRDGERTFVTFRWRRPVVVLIDQGTRSGKEVIAYGLQQHGIPLVGMRTAGALLGGRGYLLEDGSLLVLAVSDVAVDGRRLEGVGVEPDLAVPFPLPYAAGRDPQLEAALAKLAALPRS